jgi:hypothetical protein
VPSAKSNKTTADIDSKLMRSNFETFHSLIDQKPIITLPGIIREAMVQESETKLMYNGCETPITGETPTNGEKRGKHD